MANILKSIKAGAASMALLTSAGAVGATAITAPAAHAQAPIPVNPVNLCTTGECPIGANPGGGSSFNAAWLLLLYAGNLADFSDLGDAYKDSKDPRFVELLGNRVAVKAGTLREVTDKDLIARMTVENIVVGSRTEGFKQGLDGLREDLTPEIFRHIQLISPRALPDRDVSKYTHADGKYAGEFRTSDSGHYMFQSGALLSYNEASTGDESTVMVTTQKGFVGFDKRNANTSWGHLTSLDEKYEPTDYKTRYFVAEGMNGDPVFFSKVSRGKDDGIITFVAAQWSPMVEATTPAPAPLAAAPAPLAAPEAPAPTPVAKPAPAAKPAPVAKPAPAAPKYTWDGNVDVELVNTPEEWKAAKEAGVDCPPGSYLYKVDYKDPKNTDTDYVAVPMTADVNDKDLEDGMNGQSIGNYFVFNEETGKFDTDAVRGDKALGQALDFNDHFPTKVGKLVKEGIAAEQPAELPCLDGAPCVATDIAAPAAGDDVNATLNGANTSGIDGAEGGKTPPAPTSTGNVFLDGLDEAGKNPLLPLGLMAAGAVAAANRRNRRIVATVAGLGGAATVVGLSVAGILSAGVGIAALALGAAFGWAISKLSTPRTSPTTPNEPTEGDDSLHPFYTGKGKDKQQAAPLATPRATEEDVQQQQQGQGQGLAGNVADYDDQEAGAAAAPVAASEDFAEEAAAPMDEMAKKRAFLMNMDHAELVEMFLQQQQMMLSTVAELRQEVSSLRAEVKELRLAAGRPTNAQIAEGQDQQNGPAALAA